MVCVRNKDLIKLYQNIGEFSFKEYLESCHYMLQQPLADQKVPDSLSPSIPNGKKIFLIGSFLPDMSILSEIERCGLVVVGDRLTESKRLFSAPPVKLVGDLYCNIAESILENKQSPSQNDFKSIIMDDMNEIKEKKVQGVIYISQKYCEPYDYLYYAYKKMLDEINVPILHIVLSNSICNNRSAFAIETFADMI